MTPPVGVFFFFFSTGGIPHELWSGVLSVCYVDTDAVAALLMAPAAEATLCFNRADGHLKKKMNS